MTFHPEKTTLFLENFNRVKNKIRAFDGVEYLELLQDKNNTNIYFTYSHWESENHLTVYRNSDLFKSIWKITKPLFVAKAEAWSVDSIDKLG